MNKIVEELFKLQDKDYRDFQAKLIPNVGIDYFIGVRTPNLRKYAKEMIKNQSYESFLEELPHKYFDENQLHAFILSEIKDYNQLITYINSFLPYIDNWATCDQLTPNILKKNRDKLIKEIKRWLKSKEIYTLRFSIKMLMQHYLDDEFKEEYLNLVSKIKTEDYYLKMMISWYFATALSKQYPIAVKYLEEHKLDKWIHNKTIQKAIESYRITPEQKKYLKSLKK